LCHSEPLRLPDGPSLDVGMDVGLTASWFVGQSRLEFPENPERFGPAYRAVSGSPSVPFQPKFRKNWPAEASRKLGWRTPLESLFLVPG
jgi:hypothetical protein